MKTLFLLTISIVIGTCGYSQSWTPEQLDNANTAKDYDYITDDERIIVQYINLCRLYPKQFVENEVKPYRGVPGIKYKGFAKYKASLISELSRKQPLDALEFDENMYDDAECYAKEISTNKRAMHQRKDCESHGYAENLYFGRSNGKIIVLEWLIDCGIANVGHRRNCLDKLYFGIGVKMDTHYAYGQCAVAEFGN